MGPHPVARQQSKGGDVLRCLIVDDERLAREEMVRLLSCHDHVEIVGEASSISTALELSRRLQPDVVFLDVQLPRETGFDFMAQVEPPRPLIVFVTAHDRYAVRGFECNALDYLLKPVRPERLAQTLERLETRQPARSPATVDDMVFLKIGATARFVPWRNVQRVTTEGDYTRVFLEDGAVGLILCPLKEWLTMAPVGLLAQVHRQTLVRLDAIREVRYEGKGRREIVLSDGSSAAIGRHYWPQLKSLLRLD